MKKIDLLTICNIIVIVIPLKTALVKMKNEQNKKATRWDFTFRKRPRVAFVL